MHFLSCIYVDATVPNCVSSSVVAYSNTNVCCACVLAWLKDVTWPRMHYMTVIVSMFALLTNSQRASRSVFFLFFFYWSERYIADVKQYFDIKGVNKIKRKSPNQWWTSATTRRKKKIALPPHNTIPHLTPVHVESALIITATEKDLITMVVERIKADHEMR